MSQIPYNMFAISNIRNEQNLPEIITVTSGKGGVGKSSTSVNLAILLGQLKRNVLLVDADIHLGNVDLILGLRPQHTIADALTGEINLRRVIMKGPGGIDILPASSAVMDLLEMEDDIIKKLSDAFLKFEHEYDTVLVDTGAGINRNVMSFVLGADKVLLMVTPDPASIADAYGVVKVIRQSQGTMPILMIANMVNSFNEAESLFKKMNLMVNRFLDSKIYFGGAILRDNLIAESIRRQKPLVIEHPNSVPVNAMKMITRKLIKLPAMDASKRSGFFDRFRVARDIVIGIDT